MNTNENTPDYAVIRRLNCADDRLDPVLHITSDLGEAKRLADGYTQQPDSRGLIELSYGQYSRHTGDVMEVRHEIHNADYWTAITYADCEAQAEEAAIAWCKQYNYPEANDASEAIGRWISGNDRALQDVAAIIKDETGLELLPSEADDTLYLCAPLAATWGNDPIYDDNGYTIAVPHQRPATAIPGPLTEEESHDYNTTYYVDSAAAEEALYTKVKATRPHQHARILDIIAERREARQ